MEYVVTAGQMREHERFIMEEIGIDASILMERATYFAAKVMKGRINKSDRILIVCGVGNNGADGVALARILTEMGYETELLCLGSFEKYTVLRRRQEEILRNIWGEKSNERIRVGLTDTKDSEKEYSVIVDAILGIGTSRELSGQLKEAVEWMNSLSALKIALDIPTGICADTGRVLGTAFLADVTATFGLRKQGLLIGDGKIYAGEVCYNSCGMNYPAMNEKTAFLLEKKTVRELLERNPNGNKSTFGKISFFSGSKTMAGAAILNVCAAFRSGAGYVRLCTHENNKEAVLKAAPETVLDLYGNNDSDALREMVRRAIEFAHVICVGSGFGTGEVAKEIMAVLADEMQCVREKIFIFDADALNLMASDEALRNRIFASDASVVLTPHMLEFSRLCGISLEEIEKDRVEIGKKYAVEHQCVLVQKSAQTIIAGADGRVCFVNKGNDGMAVAGSGDVLAGVIAGMSGQIKEPYMAACSGVYVHGMAGDLAAEKTGKHSMLPTDMIHCVKKCMKKLGKEA